jgi:Raf kinase inhibitor-like YbhB/YbcL family protein
MQLAAAIGGIILAAATGTMQLHSGDFAGGSVIPQKLMALECGGDNRSPALAWNDSPKTTKSFALIVHDPDAPMPGGFFHWVIYNIPATVHRLSANAELAADQDGNTSLGKPGYYGPCPPPGGAHHYSFALYALDVAHIPAAQPLSADQLERRMQGHILARAVLEATASRH